jgi:hypothetical protein
MPEPPMPEPFLKGSDEITVDTAGAWGFILSQEKLILNAVHGKKDVIVDSGNDGFGVFQFTSEENNLYFGPLDNASGTAASIGDSLGCTYAFINSENPGLYSYVERV